MKLRISPIQNISLTTILIIVGILIIATTSQRIIVRNTAEAFNRQQLFLAKESARNIEGLMNNLETTLRVAADLITLYPQENIFRSIFSNQQDLMQMLFQVNIHGEIISAYPSSFLAYPDIRLVLKKSISRATVESKDVLITDFISFQNGNEKNFSFVLGVLVGRTSQWICCIPNYNAIKSKFIYPIGSGKTGYAWMIDRQGVLLAHPNKEMEGRKALNVLKELWPEYSAFNLETIINREMIRGVEGKGEYTGWHFGEKKLTKKLIAYCPIRFKNTLWSIGVSAPYQEAMAPLIQSLTWPLVFLVCFIVIIVFGACRLVIAERKKNLVHQELTWSHEVFDGITDGISIIDRDYRVLMVNRAICGWYGKPHQFFKGKPCYEVFQHQGAPCVGCPAKETFKTGKLAFRDRVSSTLGGKKYYFHLTTFPLMDEDGNTIKVAEYVKDVTQEMALRSELIQHERKSMIVKMSSQIAHEIRNPLGTLTLNIDLLEDEINNYAGIDIAEAKNLLNAIRSELEGLHKILKEYLECARFPTIKPQKHYINALLREMFSLLEEDFRRKNIVFTTNFENGLPIAEVDQDQIRRAFLNIILNAVEAMGSGGSIEVTTRSENGWIEVIFADTGVGVPDDQIEKIFTPFFTTKTGGTGLGLPITQHIIMEHKGEILCESRPGEGTRFKIRIPRGNENK